MDSLEQSDLLFDEARRLRRIGETKPYYSTGESRARELDARAWQLRRQAIREAEG